MDAEWKELNIKVNCTTQAGLLLLLFTQILAVRNHLSLELDATVGAQLTFKEVSKHLLALCTVSQTHAEDVVAAEEICGFFEMDFD